jgi:hypothetical protein
MMSVVVEELLLTRERELDSWEGTVIAREDGLLASECALGRVCMEHDTERA